MNLSSVLKEKDRLAIEEFRDRIQKVLGKKALTIKLFGSKARGEDISESDIDILIVVTAITPGLKDQVIDIAFDVNLSHDVYISPRVVPLHVFQDPLWRATPFIQNVEKEGISI
jgi:predicted nucleotidyltransferase